MADFCGERLCASERAICDFFAIFGGNTYNMRYSTLPSFIPDNNKEKMETAAAKVGWAFFYTFGGLATVLSIPDKLFSLMGLPVTTNLHLSEPYQAVVSWLAIIFLVVSISRSVVKCLDSIEIWRHKRISNNEKAYQLKRMHEIEKLNP